MTLALPRYVIAKLLASGRTAFYFNVPKKYRDLGCTVPRTSLGTDYAVACGEDGNGGRAAALNALFDEWDTPRHGLPVTGERAPIYGTIRWLFQEYRRSKAYLEKVSKRSRPDYERTMQLIEGITTKKGDKLGDRKIRSVSPISADKIYEIILTGPDGERPRQAEKVVALCRRAWRVVHRLHPGEFDREVPNPWDGVTIKRRVKAKKSAVTRDQVYAFAAERSSTARRKPQRPPLSVLNGCSVLKTCWPACFAGPTTEARNGRTPLRSYTTRPVQPFGIPWRIASTA